MVSVGLLDGMALNWKWLQTISRLVLDRYRLPSNSSMISMRVFVHGFSHRFQDISNGFSSAPRSRISSRDSNFSKPSGLGWYPNHHPFLDGIFHELSHPAMGVPAWLWKPAYLDGYCSYYSKQSDIYLNYSDLQRKDWRVRYLPEIVVFIPVRSFWDLQQIWGSGYFVILRLRLVISKHHWLCSPPIIIKTIAGW